MYVWQGLLLHKFTEAIAAQIDMTVVPKSGRDNAKLYYLFSNDKEKEGLTRL